MARPAILPATFSMPLRAKAEQYPDDADEAFLLGRRKGKKRTTVVEVRRI